ncbi:MAG: TIGR04282 family arsenosugar biosynthesis glycosyltransferase [Vicinamibacterales bacterium]|nr:TIGR04282 family arsenosugar biosynthesis glycosyltransferase [Vicinamibacterales bacterium]
MRLALHVSTTAIGLLLFVFFVRRAGIADIAAGIASVGWGFLLLLALSGFRFAMRAFAWTLCVKPSARLTFRDALKATLAGDALGNMTPLGPLVSEPAKVALVTHRIPSTDALAALAIENLFYALSVALFVTVGLIALMVRLGTGTGWWFVGGVLVAGGMMAILAVHAVMWRRLSLASRWHASLSRPWRGGWLDNSLSWLCALESRMQAAYPRKHVALGPIAVVDGLFHAAALAETYLALAFVTGSSPSWLDAFLFESVNRTIMVAFKFVPLRVGVDEASTGLFADLLQFGTATGVTIAVIRKARMLCWLAVGVPIALTRGLSATVQRPRGVTSEVGWPSALDTRGLDGKRAVIAIMARSLAEPSEIKTRLSGAIPNARDRADLYAAFIADQVRVCRSLQGVTVRLAHTPESGAKGFDTMGLRADELMPQRGRDLATRERTLFEDLFLEGFRRVIIIGSDIPSLPTHILEEAVRCLATPGRVVLGPAEDGGYYLIGLRRAGASSSIPDLFSNVRWSTPWTLVDTVAAAERSGTIVKLVEPWYDVDDQAGLEKLRNHLNDTDRAAAAPATAAALRKIF